MSHTPTRSRTRLGAAAGLLGVAAALTAVTGAGPVPSIFQLTGATEDVQGSCDEHEHAGDAACAGTLTARDSGDDSSTSTSSTIEDSSGTSPSAGESAPAEVRTVSAGDAGSIMVAVEGASLRLLTASPNVGWEVEIDHATGDEVEVTFRSGSLRVDVSVEIEDGQVRERVRTRDDDTDAETRVENGVVVDDDSDDDSSGPGSDEAVDDDSDDDSSGSSDGSDDVADDTSDDDSSGPGSDDGPGHD